jgi:hypothetical protein
LGAHIYDPQTKISYLLNPMTMVARKQIVTRPRNQETPPDAEDLGYQVLNGMQAKGTRVTRTVTAQFSGTGKEVKVEDEFWYSEELELNLLVRHSDPRAGVDTVGLSNLKREEPAAGMFQIPAGYRVVNVTPASAPPER